MMNKTELIRLGALAQRHWQMESDFEVAEIAPNEKSPVRLFSITSFETIHSRFGTILGSDLVHLKEFADSGTGKWWFMGYSKKLNMLVIQERNDDERMVKLSGKRTSKRKTYMVYG